MGDRASSGVVNAQHLKEFFLKCIDELEPIIRVECGHYAKNTGILMNGTHHSWGSLFGIARSHAICVNASVRMMT